MKSNKDFSGFLSALFEKKATVLCLFGALVLGLALFFYTPSEGESAAGELTDTAQMCAAVEGVGECRVALTHKKDKNGKETDEVFSVAVICEGADDVSVRARLTELITSLYGIGANRVSIVKLEKQMKKAE